MNDFVYVVKCQWHTDDLEYTDDMSLEAIYSNLDSAMKYATDRGAVLEKREDDKWVAVDSVDLTYEEMDECVGLYHAKTYIIHKVEVRP